MQIEVSKEWFQSRAHLEEGHEIGAGFDDKQLDALLQTGPVRECITHHHACDCRERAFRDAIDLITEIMRDEVNAQDECEKWLREYAPERLKT